MDFVLPWVNNQDTEWQKSLQQYSGISTEENKNSCRFRDWENLKYWFRSVEKFTPWVDHIFLVTCGHYPQWLNMEAPKLRFIKHSDYIPQQYLPTFSSFVIENNLWRLKELSEEFILFNDDFFILHPLPPTRFFKKGKPVDMAALNAYGGDGLSANVMNNLCIINKHFSQREVLRKNFFKFFNWHYGIWNLRTMCLLPWPKFTGFCLAHMPQPFLKSTITEVWEREKMTLEQTNASRFRSKDDVFQYLFHHWQICSGNFSPYNTKKDTQLFLLSDSNIAEAADVIYKQSKAMIALNDTEDISDFENAKQKINAALESVLPEKSIYEL